MKNLICFLVLFLIFSSAVVFAHPGNTDANGCHYCRTNCSKWGEVANQRHCHGAPVVIPVYALPPVVEEPVVETKTKVKSEVAPVVNMQSLDLLVEEDEQEEEKFVVEEIVEEELIEKEVKTSNEELSDAEAVAVLAFSGGAYWWWRKKR
jgi:hypothetical protein